MTVGLGTGSTARFFIEALARKFQSGDLRDLRCVPTSVASETLARQLGLPIADLATISVIDVTVDGADEVTPKLDLIKGLGGALLREKIIAQNSRRLVIIVDESKRVNRLGEKSPLPVEVIPYAHEIQVPFLRSLGCEPILRRGANGKTYLTDNGNYIYDCRFAGGMKDPSELYTKLSIRAGVVETGMFLGIATMALIASQSGTETLARK